MKKSRRKSRELALKGVYQWEMTGYGVPQLEEQLQDDEDFPKAELDYFRDLFRGVASEAAEWDALLTPHLDRRLPELSPIERSILRLAVYELARHPEVPYRVVINEAVELAKVYGGTDGYKYVNGVVDRLAGQLRTVEVQARAAGKGESAKGD